MYIQILNVILIIILIAIVIWLAWNIYESSQPVKKYEDLQIDKSLLLDKPIVFENDLDSVITIKAKDTYKGVLFLKIISLKHFKIDWGNGLEVPFTGSSLTQKLGPIGYGSGNFSIKILSEPNSVILLDMETSSNDFESVTFENCSKPDTFFPKWNLDNMEIKNL
jgi:hypothetical protein